MSQQFETVQWALTGNVYEVNLRQYTVEGTFAAFEKELPRLREMGIDILWFMPITPISIEKRQGSLGSYYACRDYTAVNSEYGNESDFKNLVQSAHEKGFKVIIDWVANHTGWDNMWTKEHPEFYKKNEQGNFYDPHGWVDVIDLDYNNAGLRTEMINAMRFWVEGFDIDGFRCDMAELVPLDFWRQARTELEKEKKLFWMAECEVPGYHQVFDATYAWKFLHTMEAVYKKEASLQELRNVLEEYKATFPENALRLFFTSNHDENSHSGSEYERLGEGAKAFAVLCATWHNCLPLIYSGQEMPNKKRLQFFDKDTIEWTGQYLLNDFYKTLLAIHKNRLTAANGKQPKAGMIATNAPDNIFAYSSQSEAGSVLVILNLSAASRLLFKITRDFKPGKYINAFSGVKRIIDTETTFEMQAWEYLVFVTPNP